LAIELLHEALKLGITPRDLERLKQAEPPHNILFDIGTDRNPQLVHLKHIKEHSMLLVQVGKRFTAGVPNKVICRAALCRLDDDHDNQLSKAQR
jgi:hypothetical protein